MSPKTRCKKGERKEKKRKEKESYSERDLRLPESRKSIQKAIQKEIFLNSFSIYPFSLFLTLLKRLKTLQIERNEKTRNYTYKSKTKHREANFKRKRYRKSCGCL